MKYLLPVFFFFLVCRALPGQDVPVGLSAEPEKPIVIENPATGKTLVVFYPEKASRGKKNPVGLYEVETGSLAPTQAASANLPIERPFKVRPPAPESPLLPGSGPDLRLLFPNRDIRVLCRFVRGNDYYFVLLNHRDCRLMQVSGSDLTMRQLDAFKLTKKQSVLQGVAEGSDAYVLSTLKKGRKLFVYAVNAEGKFEKHLMRTPARSFLYFEELFKKRVRPVSVEYNLEMEAEQAARPLKLYAGPGRMWMTHDIEIGSTPTYRSVAVRLMTFDLQRDSVYTQAFRHTDSTYFMEDQAAASYLLDDKLFHIYVNPALFQLRVTEVSTGRVLSTQTIYPGDSLDLASSPVLLLKRGFNKKEWESRTATEFIKHFSKFVPFVQARRVGQEYVVQIGGYVSIGGSSLGYVTAPTGNNQIITPTGIADIYKRSFGFYSALNAKTLQPSGTRFQQTLRDAYNSLSTPGIAIKYKDLYRLGDHYYQAYYKAGAKVLTFQPVPGY